MVRANFKQSTLLESLDTLFEDGGNIYIKPPFDKYYRVSDPAEIADLEGMDVIEFQNFEAEDPVREYTNVVGYAIAKDEYRDQIESASGLAYAEIGEDGKLYYNVGDRVFEVETDDLGINYDEMGREVESEVVKSPSKGSKKALNENDVPAGDLDEGEPEIVVFEGSRTVPFCEIGPANLFVHHYEYYDIEVPDKVKEELAKYGNKIIEVRTGYESEIFDDGQFEVVREVPLDEYKKLVTNAYVPTRGGEEFGNELKQRILSNLGESEKLTEDESKDNEPAKYKVSFYPYDRYGSDEGLKNASFNAKTLKDALKKLADRLGLYLEPEDIDEEYSDAREALESIKDSNGDGCDYIVLFKNETTGEVYIEENYKPEDLDWDDDEYDESEKPKKAKKSLKEMGNFAGRMDTVRAAGDRAAAYRQDVSDQKNAKIRDLFNRLKEIQDDVAELKEISKHVSLYKLKDRYGIWLDASGRGLDYEDPDDSWNTLYVDTDKIQMSEHMLATSEITADKMTEPNPFHHKNTFIKLATEMLDNYPGYIKAVNQMIDDYDLKYPVRSQEGVNESEKPKRGKRTLKELDSKDNTSSIYIDLSELISYAEKYISGELKKNGGSDVKITTTQDGQYMITLNRGDNSIKAYCDLGFSNADEELEEKEGTYTDHTAIMNNIYDILSDHNDEFLFDEGCNLNLTTDNIIYIEDNKDGSMYSLNLKDESTMNEAENVANRDFNKLIKDVLDGNKKAKRELNKMGYDVEYDNDAQKQFGKKYFGKYVTIKNLKTGKEIVSSYDNYFDSDNFINARPIEDKKGAIWHRIKQGKHSPKDAKKVDQNKFDYKGYLDKETPDLKEPVNKVKQFKDDKAFLKAHDYEARQIDQARDRVASVRSKLNKDKDVK